MTKTSHQVIWKLWISQIFLSMSCLTSCATIAPSDKQKTKTFVKNNANIKFSSDLKTSPTVRQFPKKSLAFIAKHTPENLAKNAYFIRAFRDLVQNTKMNATEKALGFFLMKRSFGWGFDGTRYIPPGASYYKAFQGEVIFHYRISQASADLAINVDSLLDLAQNKYKEDVLLAGNALLLATILDKKKASKTVHSFLAMSKIKQAQVPEILHNYVSHSILFVINADDIKILTQNLNQLKPKESKEEIITILAIYPAPSSIEAITKYVCSEDDPNNNLAIETSILALKNALPTSKLKATVQEIRSHIKGTWKEKIFNQIINSTSNHDSVEGSLKSWSFASLTIYQNGVMVTGPKGYQVFSPHSFTW